MNEKEIKSRLYFGALFDASSTCVCQRKFNKHTCYHKEVLFFSQTKNWCTISCFIVKQHILSSKYIQNTGNFVVYLIIKNVVIMQTCQTIIPSLFLLDLKENPNAIVHNPSDLWMCQNTSN